jgi:hypothetical protein
MKVSVKMASRITELNRRIVDSNGLDREAVAELQAMARAEKLQPARKMTPRQRAVELAGMRWPKPKLTIRQKLVELMRIGPV